MKKVLLVDDAVLMREMLRYILSEDKEIEISEAANGADAISQYIQNKPDVVLMDIIMPDMNGIEALIEIKKIDSNAKVIICSQLKKENMIIEAIKSGAADFIIKPFVAERVAHAVRNIIGKAYLRSYGE